MREIYLDTETTGGSFRGGDRIVEIGLVEIEDRRPTGRVFHEFLNPQRAVHFAAHRIHGLRASALEGQPLFAQIAPRMLEFIGDAPVLIQNVKFDRAFVNGELAIAGLPVIEDRRLKETMDIFRGSVRSSSLKLDDVVAALGMPTPDRRIHGALLDAAILASAVSMARKGQPFDIEAIVALGNEGRVRRDAVAGAVRRQASSAAPPPSSRPSYPASAAAPKVPPALADGLAAVIEAVNGRPAACVAEPYQALRSGRDRWSSAQASDIEAQAAAALQRHARGQELGGFLGQMDQTSRLAAMRWICRGLDPAHAFCMTVVREIQYERPPAQSILDFARDLAGETDPLPEP